MAGKADKADKAAEKSSKIPVTIPTWMKSKQII